MKFVNDIRLLDEFSTIEARRLAEFKFLGWVFLLQQVISILVIAGTLWKLFDHEYIKGVLNVVSQDSNSIYALLAIAVLHAGILVLLLFFRRPFVLYVTLSMLAGMVICSAVKLILGQFDPFILGGIGVSTLWCIYFFFSKSIGVRFFYEPLFKKACQTIVCPHCGKEVKIDAEDCCEKPLSDDERFEALCTRITDIGVPVDVRVAQLELLDERFGKKARSFIKEQLEIQMKSPARAAKLAAALYRINDRKS